MSEMKAFAALREQATKRPWQYERRVIDNADHFDALPIAITSSADNSDVLVATGDDNEAWLDVSESNSAFLTLAANYVERLVVTVEQQARKIHNDGQVIGRTTFEECVAADCVEAKKFLAEIEEAAKGE